MGSECNKMQKSLLYSSKLLVVVNKTVTPIEAEYRAACPGTMPSTILRRKKITSSKSSRHAPVHSAWFLRSVAIRKKSPKIIWEPGGNNQ